MYEAHDNAVFVLIAFMDTSNIICGALMGLLVDLIAEADGALMTPLLILIFHMGPLVAVFADLWFASLIKIAGLLIHLRHAQVDWIVIRHLFLGSLPVPVIILLYILQGKVR